MSEPAAKRPSMDFEEFERRLRAPEPAPQSAGHDPLAELARLVDGHQDPYADMFRPGQRAEAPAMRAVQPGGGMPHLAAVPPVELPGSDDWRMRRDEWPPNIPAQQQAAPPAIEPMAEPAYDSYAPEDYEAPAPQRSRKALYLMAASLVAVAAGVGATVLTRGTRHTAQDAPIIKAAQGPMKITPEAPAASSDSTRTATVLERSADQLGSSKVVGREEQPIDLSAVKTVRSAPAQPPAAAAALFPEPRRVRTIPVRPDGTLVSEPAPSPRPAATAAAATPAPSAAGKPTTTASIAPPSMPKTAAPATSAATPPATLAPKTTARVEAPAPTRQAAVAKPAALSAVVDRSPPAAQASAGGFAVQLAATTSDSEARDRAGRLAGQFSAALGGRRPSVVHGEANGHSIYRVRVTGLSREEAAAMCGKIKGGGGACFVAH